MQMGLQLSRRVISLFLGMGVTRPLFHSEGIKPLLIDKLNIKLICSGKIRKIFNYVSELMLKQPEDLVGLNPSRIFINSSGIIEFIEPDSQSVSSIVPGSLTSGIHAARRGPTSVKKLFITSAVSLISHKVPEMGLMTLTFDVDILSTPVNCEILVQNFFESLTYNSNWFR